MLTSFESPVTLVPMFRWADPDYEMRIARLERAVTVLAILLVLMIAALGVTTWNDVNQASTEESIANTQSSLVEVSAGQQKIDKAQNDAIGHLIATDRSQNGLLKPPR